MSVYPTASNPTIKIGKYDGKDVYMTRYAGTMSGMTNNVSNGIYLENGFNATKHIMDFCGYQEYNGGEMAIPFTSNYNSNTLTSNFTVTVNNTGLIYTSYSYSGASQFNGYDYTIFVTWYNK